MFLNENGPGEKWGGGRPPPLPPLAGATEHGDRPKWLESIKDDSNI